MSDQKSLIQSLRADIEETERLIERQLRGQRLFTAVSIILSLATIAVAVLALVSAQ